jgi:hypothetical protein
MRAGLVWRLRATSKRYQPTVFKRRVILSAGWYKILLFLKKKKQKDFYPVVSERQLPRSGQCRRH